jgi:hypothetical protein
MGILTLSLFLSGFIVTLISSTAARLKNGATLRELRRTRFYEIVPVRAMILVVQGLAVSAAGISLLMLAQRIFRLLGQRSGDTAAVVETLGFLVIASGLFGISWLWWNRMVLLPALQPPSVDVSQVALSRHIPAQDMAQLGLERFPNRIARNRLSDNLLRACVALFCLFLIAGLIYLRYQGIWGERVNPSLVQIGAAFRQYPISEIAFFLLVISTVSLGALLYDNRDYTFFPFRRALTIQLVLSVIVGGSLMVVRTAGEHIWWGALLLCAANGWRAFADLWADRRYGKMKRVYDPIADQLQREVYYLNAIRMHPDYQFETLNPMEIGARISQGCNNVEEKGFFVTRFFARFIRLVEVRTEDMAVAMMRYLTVRRYLTLSGGWPTVSPLRSPSVPIWNLQLFPLNPPQGFLNWLDPLLLGSEWDVVKICGGCSGSGRVQRTVTEYRTEYYTDSDGRPASRQVAVYRTEWVTCPTCNGSGRLLYQQVLNTQWQRIMPTVTSPRMMMPELVEDSEERVYFRLPLTEAFDNLPFCPQIEGRESDLQEQMLESACRLSGAHIQNTVEVERLHDGRLYRADFQIAGFRTICIRFTSLGGRIGWFFGRRPEFYFPRLPLSYSALGTLLFLPPLVLALAGFILRAAGLLLGNR